MSCTNVYYNGVQIHNCLTREFDESVEYDPSRTDITHHRIRMQFEGTVHADMGASGAYIKNPIWISRGDGSDSGGSDWTHVSSAIGVLSSYLLSCRHKLEIKYESSPGYETTFLSVYPSTSAYLSQPTRDVDNGPKPTGFRVLSIIGGGFYKVSWSVDVSLVLCLTSEGASTVPGVLNNRWSVAESLDGNYFMTRTITGRMRLSAPQAAIGDFRNVCVPSLESGFRREGIEYTVDPSGLECSYRVYDKQINSAPPWPATSWKVRHEESSNDAIKPTSAVSVQLWGPPGVDRTLLISRLIDVVDAKLGVLTAPRGQIIPEEIAIVDTMGSDQETMVEARVRVSRTLGSGSETGSFGKFFENLKNNVMGKSIVFADMTDQPEAYNPAKSYSPNNYGYQFNSEPRNPLASLMLSCYLQSPCSGPHNIAGGTVVVTTTQSSNVVPDPEQSENTPSSPDTETTTDASETAKTSVYSYCRMGNTYTVQTMRLQCPIGVVPTDPTAATSVFPQLCGGQAQRIVEFDAERAGAWPEIPTPADTYTAPSGLKGYLLDKRIEPSPPTIAADLVTAIYRVSGTYVFGLSRPPMAGEALDTGALPFTKYEAAQNLFTPASAYKGRLLGQNVSDNA